MSVSLLVTFTIKVRDLGMIRSKNLTPYTCLISRLLYFCGYERFFFLSPFDNDFDLNDFW